MFWLHFEFKLASSSSIEFINSHRRPQLSLSLSFIVYCGSSSVRIVNYYCRFRLCLSSTAIVIDHQLRPSSTVIVPVRVRQLLSSSSSVFIVHRYRARPCSPSATTVSASSFAVAVPRVHHRFLSSSSSGDCC